MAVSSGFRSVRCAKSSRGIALRNRLADNPAMKEGLGLGFLVTFLVVLLPGLAAAADCISVQHDDVSILAAAPCGELRLMQRRRDDQRPNIDIAATWIEFTAPSGPGEWRYNDWVRTQLASLNFDKPLAAGHKSEDYLAIRSLYRSQRLISARYARRVCCGSSGTTIYGSVNVDLARWTLLSPDELVSLGATANTCWRQFAGEKKRGARFAGAWPNERPWLDREFEGFRIGPVMRDLIGPVVLDPEPSRDRTRRVFVSVLKDQTRWSFSEDGALIDFGELLGFSAGAFFCVLPNTELRAVARPGVAVPP
jgi:hypothetical protein